MLVISYNEGIVGVIIIPTRDCRSCYYTNEGIVGVFQILHHQPICHTSSPPKEDTAAQIRNIVCTTTHICPLDETLPSNRKHQIIQMTSVT